METGIDVEQSGIVTFIVSHRVRKERIEEFEHVNRTLNRIVESAPGYLGINVIRSARDTHVEYTVILRFDSYRSLKAWADSPKRREYVARLREISDHTQEKLETGLEYWFTIDGSSEKPSPPRYKMAAITILVIYPLVIVVPWLVSRISVSLGIPFALQVLLSVLLITVLMTYYAMPIVTRVFSRWLYSN